MQEYYVKRKEKKTEIDRVIDITGLKDVQKKLIRNLSRGYRQRVSLAGVLVGNPPILILDEPTVGLDPKQVIEIRSLIKSLGDKHTILVSSHILSEISQMCNKIIIINKGKILRTGSTDEIEKLATDSSEILVTVDDEENKFNIMKKIISDITEITLVEDREKEKVYKIKYNGNDDIRKTLFKECANHNITIIEMKKKENSLEEAFLKITEEEESK